MLHKNAVPGPLYEAEDVEEVCSLFLKANEKTRCEFNA